MTDIKWYLSTAGSELEIQNFTFVFPVPGAGVLVRNESLVEAEEGALRIAESMAFVPDALIEVNERGHGLARAPVEGEENKVGRVVKATD